MPTLRDIRTEHYLRQSELAELADVSMSTIVRMEKPNNRIRQDVAEKVIAALGKRIGKSLSLNDVEGLNIYDVMRDRNNDKRKEA